MKHFHNKKTNDYLKKIQELQLFQHFKENEKELTAVEEKQLEQIKKTLRIFMSQGKTKEALEYCEYMKKRLTT